MALARALAVRLLVFGLTLLGVVALVQVLLVLAPGDPIDLLPNGAELRPRLEAEWGLDRSLPERIGRYALRVLSGDWGQSLTVRPGTPVLELIGGPALRSVALWLASLTLAVVWGTGLAWIRSSGVRRVVQAVSIAPVFLLVHGAVNGLNAATWAAMEAGSIGRPGWFALPVEDSWTRTVLAILILAVGSGALAEITREVDAVLREIRRSDYVDAARARGASLWPHVALNLVGPISSLVATRAAFFVGGLVVIEKLMLLNGVGALLWNAAVLRDYDLAMGIALLAGAAVCTVRLVADAVKLGVDPRLRT